MSPRTRRPGELPPLPKSQATSTPPADAVIGTVIGDRYKLLERIGAGGMATVYRAEHQSLKKAVAVKLLLPELALDQDMVGRFEREAVAAARLDHPNCVSITDFGRMPGGRLYIVMEYLEGTPLSEIAGYGKRLPWERSVEITRQILRGLGRAHEMGIVHRDLKPSNIMITALPGNRDLAKIIDFGIAKLFDGSQAGPHVETKAGIVFGTADFLAPERLLGKGDTDPRSDLYSVAVLLYEMVTGERPFHDEDPYVIVKRALGETPRPPSQVAPDAGIPAPLEEAILRGLEKDPDKRFPAARDFLAMLDPIGKRAQSTTDYLAGKASQGQAGTGAISSGPLGASPIAATPSASSLLPADPAQRRRVLFWLGGGAAALILIPLLILGIVLASEDDSPATGRGPSLEPSASIEVDALVKQAADGDTVEARQRAFDRLVALGFRDRVPWVAMLSRDLEQLPTCEQRAEVVARLQKLGDPAANPALEKAAARPDNDCFAKRLRKPTSTPTDTPTPPRKPPRSGGGGGGGGSSGGGGHF